MWVPIGKSNCYLDLDKSQGNPIYKIAVDLLKNTNFLRAFTASSTIPSIYIQQFWDTVQYDKKATNYRCQLDEQWFVLTKDTLREALHITPVNNNQAFVAPPSSDALINFVNELGYPKEEKGHSDCDSKHPVHQANHPSPSEEAQFNAKGTKREVFRMPIPGSLITVDIREALYYQEYLENVAKHRRYLVDETLSAKDSPTPKPTKPARKPKSIASKAPPRPSVSTLVTSAQLAPTSAPAKPQDKKRKKATDTSDKPTKAKKFKYSDVSKVRKPRSSLKSVAASEAEDVPAMEPQGSAPTVVIRELESGKYQPLPKVPGKGKAKVTKEQVAHDLLSLQKLKKKSPVDQYIFQRCTFTTTGSSRHDEPSYAELEQSKCEETKKGVLGADEVGQGDNKGQAGPDPGQARSNPDETSEGQAGPDPGNAGAEVQSIPSPMVYAGLDYEYMDLDVADVPPQPSTEQLDEGDKPSEADNNKATAKTEVESMVSVTIQQDMSTITPSMWTIPPMMSPIIDPTSKPESPKVQQHFKATTIETTTTTTATPPPPIAQQQSITEAMMMKRIGELEHIMANLIQLNKEMEERLDKHGARLYTLEQLDIPQQELTQDLAEARKKKKKSHESPKTPPGSPPHQPPPPPPPSGSSRASKALRASGSSQVPPPPPPPSSTNQENLDMDEDMAPDEQVQLSDDEDIRSVHIPKVTLRKDWWKPLEEERPATPEPIWSILSSDAPTGSARDEELLSSNLKTWKALLLKSLRHNFSKPLPLGGPPGQVTIQSDFFFNKDLKYLRYGSKGSRPALSISKMKATYYPNDGLEQQLYIDRHTSEGDRGTVKTHIQILSVVRIKVFTMYGYDYMKKIVLRRADLNEHVIAKRDFKYLYPSDFEDLYLLNLQGHLNHLPPRDKKILTTAVNQWTRHLVIRQRIKDFQLGIESYQTQLNLTKPQWNATGFEYKHDYTVIDSPRAVMFWEKYEDVDQSKAFMFAIQRRLKTKRIFRNLESFVGGRLKEGDYRLLKRTE
nr:hypothetical protein [Tanacetum cinerariifolium]